MKTRTSAPPQTDENECRSCGGYGYFDVDEKPTVDRSWLGRGGRKCLDCRGTGQAPKKKTRKKT